MKLIDMYMISCKLVLSGIVAKVSTPTAVVFGIYPCSLFSTT